MRLIRNTTPDGSCKYRLWNNALGRFEDDDKPGDLNEFFLIKLKDRNSEAALLAYAASVEARDPEFAADVRELAARSGPHHAACKDPDSEAALSTPPSRPQGEEGWLIEGWSSKRNEFKAEWWSLTPTEDERGQWTKNSLHALRFARECDAQAYIAEAGWTEARPTEHAWSALSNQGKPSS